MEKYFDVYCTTECLDFVADKIQNLIDFNPQDREMKKKLLHWVDFIFEKHTAIAISGIPSENNPLINQFILQGRFDVFTNSLSEEDFCKKKSLRKFLFSKKENIINNDIPKFDNEQLIQNWNRYTSGQKWEVSQSGTYEKSLRDYNEIRGFKHPLDAVIISDNYIIDRNYDNLNDILNCMLKGKFSENKIQVAIFTSNFPKTKNILPNGDTIWIERSMKVVYNQIVQILNNIVTDKNIELMLVKASIKDQHDRFIHTNYFTFNSGNSFTYFYYNYNTGEKEIRLSSPTYLKEISNNAFDEDEGRINAQYFITSDFHYLKLQAEKAQKEGRVIGEFKSRLLGLE